MLRALCGRCEVTNVAEKPLPQCRIGDQSENHTDACGAKAIVPAPLGTFAKVAAKKGADPKKPADAKVADAKNPADPKAAGMKPGDDKMGAKKPPQDE